MVTFLRQSGNRKIRSLENFAAWKIDNLHTVKGGNCFYKQAAAELVAQRAREVVNAHYKGHPGWQCLHDPVSDWENCHFIHLATLLDVGTCTVKRIFGHRCHDGETENISPKVKGKLRAFLETDDLDRTLHNHVVQNGDLPK